LNIGGADGANVIPELLEAARDARVIILMSIRDLRAYCSTVFLGARGLVLKEETSKTLINAIEKVHAGGVWIGSLTSTKLLVPAAVAGKGSDPEAYKIALLTNREREVLAVAVAGLKNKQISKRLFISEATVSHHLTSIFSKLHVADRSQLIAYAYQHGLAGNAC
jgi:DNA-binding NarL/FixJ family response regulator